ncbi:MAG: hypothetical protein M3430_03730 [Acidobacteriota bacterium]|nr:hypothetical protein [Acidobacteriota bacterium]
MADFYRMQPNVVIGLVNGSLQMLSMQADVRNVTQIPYIELQSEYFRGMRGEARGFGRLGLAAVGVLPLGELSTTLRCESKTVRRY